nr:MAG TPA: hypothetical protein [Caudoviricetes sp.]
MILIVRGQHLFVWVNYLKRLLNLRQSGLRLDYMVLADTGRSVA